MEIYTIDESNSQRFAKMPKDLLENECYRKNLTSDAKLVYTILLDRMELSRENEWINENGEIFLLYTKEKLADLLSISERTVYNAFDDLEKLDLLKQERQGLGKPNKLYIGKTSPRFKFDCNRCNSEPEKCAGQDKHNLQGNDTDCIETEKSETENYNVRLPSYGNWFPIYKKIYQDYMNEPHPFIPEESLDKINKQIENFEDMFDIYESKIAEIARYYFDYEVEYKSEANMALFVKKFRRMADEAGVYLS